MQHISTVEHFDFNNDLIHRPKAAETTPAIVSQKLELNSEYQVVIVLLLLVYQNLWYGETSP